LWQVMAFGGGLLEGCARFQRDHTTDGFLSAILAHSLSQLLCACSEAHTSNRFFATRT
jgi:hypothetical protein